MFYNEWKSKSWHNTRFTGKFFRYKYVSKEFYGICRLALAHKSSSKRERKIFYQCFQRQTRARSEGLWQSLLYPVPCYLYLNTEKGTLKKKRRADFAPCTLYPVLKVFVYPSIVWRGRGGPFAASKLLQNCIWCYICIFDMLGIWKEGFQ